MTVTVPDDERAAVVALLSLPGMGPARIDAVLAHAGSPTAAWDAVRRGRLDGVDLRSTTTRPALIDGWRARAATIHPDDLLRAHHDAGVQVLVPADPAWPVGLVDDPEPPVALFARGDLALLARRGVAVVGARRCTAAGAHIARQLGAGLADAGVAVVSGLALGIDGAAHRGALEAGGPPVGVVGSGLDVVYPPRHRALWEQVAVAGVLVGEAPLGARPERWRFPARNRLIAALSLAVVVVESRVHGGSMSTVAEAQARQIEVLAVPGSVLSEQSAGTNRLLSEGAAVARDADDVLATIGASLPLRRPSGPSSPGERGGEVGGATGPVGRVLSPAAASLEQLASAAGVSIAEAMTELARLEVAGVARRVPGGYEQVLR